MKKLLLTMFFFLSANAYANLETLFNMAYVEVNDNNLINAACYVRSDNGKPFIDMVSIFAANINGTKPDQPLIYFNPQVDLILNHTNTVARLQANGIKVLLTLLGNHQNAGWACMTNANAIQKFADEVVYVTNKYHLDGIDIDDEYSNCKRNNTSIIKIARAIKNNPGFKGKILSKALFDDYADFASTDEGAKLADFLDYGWEMSYFSANYAGRTKPYLDFGVPKKNLSLGVSTNNTYPLPSDVAAFIKQNKLGGVMVYNLRNNSRDYLNLLAKTEYGVTINVIPNCLDS